MDAYCREIRKLEAKFYGLEFHHVPRDDNVAADALSKIGSKRSIIQLGVFVQALNSPTVEMEEEPPTKPDLVPSIGQQVLVTLQVSTILEHRIICAFVCLSLFAS